MKAQSVNAAGTWHAYLSTQGPNAINARDRIGNGPWYNAKGQRIAKDLSDLHGDTLEQARVGNAVSKATVLDEKGNTLAASVMMFNQHDILTGSTPDGQRIDSADHDLQQSATSDSTGIKPGRTLPDRTGAGLNTSGMLRRHPSAGCSQTIQPAPAAVVSFAGAQTRLVDK